MRCLLQWRQFILLFLFKAKWPFLNLSHHSFSLFLIQTMVESRKLWLLIDRANIAEITHLFQAVFICYVSARKQFQDSALRIQTDTAFTLFWEGCPNQHQIISLIGVEIILKKLPQIGHPNIPLQFVWVAVIYFR